MSRKLFALVATIAVVVMLGAALVTGCGLAATKEDVDKSVATAVAKIPTPAPPAPTQVPLDPNKVAQALATLTAPSPTTTPTTTPTPNLQATVVALQTQVAGGKPAAPASTPIVITSTAGTTVTVIPITSTMQLSYTVKFTETVQGWALNWATGAFRDRGDGTTFYSYTQKVWPTWWKVTPEIWPTPPNEPNPLVPAFKVVGGKQVPDGIEIPQGEANYCQVLQGQLCTNPVAPQHYVLFTGDGEIPGLWKSMTGYGNDLSIWNVGNVTARIDGAFFQGWRNSGRYWNGDTLPIAIAALTSHTANVMHNLKSSLNPSGVVNAGGNCSIPSGCEKVYHTVIVTSGNEVLLVATNVTTR